MSPHYIQNVDNPCSLLQIDHIVLFTPDYFGLNLEATDHLPYLPGLGFILAYEFQMIAFLGIAHGSNTQKSAPQESSSAAAISDE